MQKAFTCPLSSQLISEPVSSIYGHLFERKEIERYVSLHKKCPITGKPLRTEDLVP
jgi:pre-mRNA-processing factor 19